MTSRLRPDQSSIPATSAALSRNNQHVQRLRRLTGRRDARLAEGCVVVEGAKVLGEALDAERPIQAVFVVEGTSDPVVARVAANGVTIHVLCAGVLERVGDAVTPQPIAAIVEWEASELTGLRPSMAAGGFVLVGVDVRDPGNVGTLIRSAEAAGAVGVILSGTSVDVTSPKVVRSSAGGLFHVPIVVAAVSTTDVAATLRSWGVCVWATAVRPGLTVDYDRADLTGPTAIIVGNEAHGLGARELAAVDALLTIPMQGRSESLNVGVAGSILAFESSRQRRARRADSSQ